MKTPVEEKFSQSFDSLPTLSPIALQLLEAAINSDAARIVEIIEKDPAIASKVLQVANSVYYGFRGQVSALNRAVALLGNEMIRAIALSVSFFRAFESWSEQQGDFDPRDFWKHSLAVALAAQVIGAKSGYGDTGTLYAGGLLHDIGRLALYAAHPQAYAAVVAESFNLSKPLIECERAEFGVDHTIVGHNLALRWRLPDQLGECIRYHHVSFTAGAGYPSFHQIIAFANAVAHQQWIGSQGYRIPALLGDDVWKRYGMDRRAEAEIKSVLLDGLRKLAPIFNFDLEADALYLDAVFRANRTLSQMAQELERRGQRLQQDLMRSRFAEVLYARFSPGLSMAETLESAARVICLTLPGVRAAGMIWTPGAAEAQAAVCSGESAASCSSRIASSCFHIANETPLMRSKQFLLALEKDLDEASLGQKMSEGRILIIPFVWLQVLEGCLVVDTRGAEKPLEKWMAKPLGEFAERAATSLERSWLHEDLQRRNEELKQANQMAESFRAQMRNAERLAAAGSMAAGVAHEINNPLSIIRGQAQLLLMRETNPDRQNRLRIIDDQSHRISKTLTDLMGIARPSRGVIADVNVAEVLSRTLAMFKHRFLHRHIQLAENYDETLPMIKADPDLLQQLFLNIIINADHALGKEGRLAVSARAGFGAKTLVVEIDDTGCGISEENLGKIFDPFFTTKEKGKGTGLGLFTSRSIIESMSGDIQVRSQAGQGTCFTLTLPVDQEVKGPGQRVPTQTRNSKEPAMILVVDDDAMIREILTEALTASRYRTDVAADGLQAMQKLQSGKYDCILLDLRLPNRSGVEVMQWLQSDARKQTAPPVIAVTGLADVDETEAALRLGALACVKKPFSIETVLSEIESALARVFVDSNY